MVREGTVGLDRGISGLLPGDGESGVVGGGVSIGVVGSKLSYASSEDGR
jgi:hypothetical protein